MAEKIETVPSDLKRDDGITELKRSSTDSQRVQNAKDAVRILDDAANARYKPYSKSLIRLYLVLIIPYLCGCLNGYDGSLMGGLNGMHSYQDYFHMYAPGSG